MTHRVIVSDRSTLETIQIFIDNTVAKLTIRQLNNSFLGNGKYQTSAACCGFVK